MLKTVTPLVPRSLAFRDRDASFAMPDWVLADKLEPPRQRTSNVVRASLLERLEGATDLPLTLLLSPPGFGKTTLLGQWHRRLRARPDMHAAWLSLEEEDADPARFLAYLAMALVAAGIAPDALPPALLEQRHDFDVQAAQATLIGLLRRSPRRVALVLDDYERAGHPAIDEIVLRLVEHGGPQLRLLLATRTLPSLPLARLATRGCLERIDARAMALDDGEARQLLGPQWPGETIAQLQRQTEGWAAALQLAALWMAGDTRRGDDPGAFSSQTCGVADYLAEQVFHDLEAPLREFLMQTSLLDRFDAALADHVRGSDDSDLLLSRLDRFHGLLVPIGDRDGYRYHPLFADFLRRQLQRHAPARPALLHQRAADALAARGQWLEAVRHALLAGNEDQAARHVAEAGRWQILLHRGIGYARALLGAFPPQAILDRPALNLTHAYLHIRLGELADAQRLLERFRTLPENARAPFERDYTIVVALLRSLLDQISHDPLGAERIAAQAAALDGDDHLGRGVLLCISATAMLGRGQFAAAERHAAQALDSMRRAGRQIGTGYALMTLGQSHYYRGRTDEAQALYRQVLAITEQQSGIDGTLQASARCLLAQSLCEHGHYDEAASGLQAAVTYLEQHDGRFDILAAAYATVLTLERQRDHSQRAALERLDHIERFASQRHLGRLLDLAMAWRIDVLLDQPAASTAGIDLLIERAGGEARFIHALRNGHGWRLRAALGFVLARWHQQAGRTPQALQLLQALESTCLESGNQCHLARARIRIALILHQRGEIGRALPYLRQALEYVALTRSWQAVLDLGLPAKALLRCARQNDPEAAPNTTLALTIQTLIERLHHEDEAAGDCSERELEMLAELAHGHSNKKIARRLNLSENTVKFHLKNLYRKLGADSRETALTLALQRGLVRPRPVADSVAIDPERHAASEGIARLLPHQ